jgi:uncharacterized protein YjbJ (UPF0337 family)
MNRDVIAGKWHQIRGDLKTRWAKLTDNDVERAEGSFEYLVGLVQERYGMVREVAERQVREFGRGYESEAGREDARDDSDDTGPTHH